MSNSIEVTIGGTDAQLLQIWQKQNAEILKNQRALIAMGQAGENAGQKVGRGAELATGRLQQFLGAIAGTGSLIGAIHLAAEQLKREYEDLRNRQRQAGERQVSAAVAQREAISNLGGDKTLTVDQMNKRVEQISTRTGMLPADVFQVMATGLSFKDRGMAAGEVPALAEIAASQSPESASAASANIKALMAIKKQNPKLSAKDIAGFLIAAKLASPVVQDEQFGSNIAPAMAQLMSLGSTERESAAFAGALGQGIGDEEGRITANASITFAKQLAEMMPNVKGGLFGRLAYMQTPEGLKYKRKLLGPLLQQAKGAKKVGLEGEAKAFTTLVGFIQGEGRYSEMLQATLDETPEAVGAGRFIDERERDLAAQNLQKQFRLNQTLEGAAERLALNDLSGGRQGITRKGIEDLLTKSGASPLHRELLMESFNLRTEGAPEGLLANLALGGLSFGFATRKRKLESPEAVAESIFRDEADRIESGGRLSLTGDGGKATQEMLRAASLLREAAELLKAGGGLIKVEAEGPIRAKAGPAAAADRRATDGGR